MKYLIPILLILSSCKQDCKDCITWTASNYFEVQNYCNGESYEFNNFTESILGEDKGIACNEEEEIMIESETSVEYVPLCDTVYTVYYFVKCNY